MFLGQSTDSSREKTHERTLGDAGSIPACSRVSDSFVESKLTTPAQLRA